MNINDNLAELRLIQRLPPDELDRFVKALFKGTVFTSAHIAVKYPNMSPDDQTDMARRIFVPLGMGGTEAIGIFKSNVKDVGTFYEYMDKAEKLPISKATGFPVFLSVNILHMDDWVKATVRVQKMNQVRQTGMGRREEKIAKHAKNYAKQHPFR
ncbi:hypothetical protein LCGC14_2045810 [marine sediment metagenome]|uniref:Uncharacterized protein n=1 Tax=marine sediment metagenome TaxID=412755 RepID=A0A0F9EQG0_9ZZZZ